VSKLLKMVGHTEPTQDKLNALLPEKKLVDPDEVFDEVSLLAMTSYNYIFVLLKRFPVAKSNV